MGPWIVTGLDPRDMTTQVRLNGKTVHSVYHQQHAIQRGRGDQPEFPRPTRCHRAMSFGSAPTEVPLAMKPGDDLEIEITGIGVLRNSVVAGSF